MGSASQKDHGMQHRGAWLTPSLSALGRGAFLRLLRQLYWGTKGRLLLPTKSQVLRRLPFGNEAYNIQNAGSAKCQAAPCGPADGLPCWCSPAASPGVR